jgi:hypothetical protein
MGYPYAQTRLDLCHLLSPMMEADWLVPWNLDEVPARQQGTGTANGKMTVFDRFL